MGFAETVAGFDWITPVLIFVQDAMYGPAHRFVVPADCGWSGKGIESLLRSRGVKTWGLMWIDDCYLFNCPERQARWAQWLLLNQGIPIAKGIIAGEAAMPQGKAPKDALERLLGI